MIRKTKKIKKKMIRKREDKENIRESKENVVGSKKSKKTSKE